jgi:hypothetical protein
MRDEQTQQQIQPPSELQGQGHKVKGVSRKQRVAATVIAAVIVTTVIASAQVLSILNIIPEPTRALSPVLTMPHSLGSSGRPTSSPKP